MYKRQAYVASKNLTTFAGDKNSKILFTDINSGDILFADSADSNQTLLKDKNGYSFINPANQTSFDIVQASDGTIQLLSLREAGNITKTITETISKRVKVGRKFKYVTQEVTSEVTEWSEGGFVLTTFDSFGNLIQETTELNPADDATYEAEKLFGIDLNKDNHQGRNVSQLDELLEIRNVGFNTFDDTANLTDLYACLLYTSPSPRDG